MVRAKPRSTARVDDRSGIAQTVRAMEAPRFEDSVRSRAALLDGPRFRVALRIALAGMASQLADAKTRLAPILSPALLQEVVSDDEHAAPPASLQEIYLGVAVGARVRVGIAITVVQAVVAEVADRLGQIGRRELARALPAAWVDLLGEVDPSCQSKPDAGARSSRADDFDFGSPVRPG
jgi:hypothetical protein